MPDRIVPDRGSRQPGSVDLAFRQHARTGAAPLEGKATVDSHVPGTTPPPRTPRRPHRRWGARPLVTLIEAVLAGVGGVYLTTGSVAVTAVAAAVAVIVVALVLLAQR
jgi:hypothetical protein